MKFCTSCGQPIMENSKFCSECGKAVSVNGLNVEMQRKMVHEYEVYKCPSCGNVLNSFVSNCPACGCEIRGVKATNSIREFALKLEEIENKREAQKLQSMFRRIFSDGKLSKTDEQKVNLIRNFSIPNTKEDIFEFMILASSNIDIKLYGLGDKGVITTSQREVSDAWLAKFEQAYEKAKLTFGETLDFQNIQKIYEQTIKKIKKEKRKLPLLITVSLVPWIIVIVVCLLLPEPSVEKKIKNREEHLEYVIEQIEDNIAEGDFKSARNKAYTIYFDPELSSEKAEKWEKKQEDMLERIERAEKQEK